ncbi:hypothetical protein HK102_013014, partial [Quaeritorhiza haematococci]
VQFPVTARVSPMVSPRVKDTGPETVRDPPMEVFPVTLAVFVDKPVKTPLAAVSVWPAVAFLAIPIPPARTKAPVDTDTESTVLEASAVPPHVRFPVTAVDPLTLRFCWTFRVFAIPTPPATIRAPD